MLKFSTCSDEKILEAESILGIQIHQIMPDTFNHEIQSVLLEEVIREKAIRAFKSNKMSPVLVEHTGLFIDDLNSLPGALSGTFFNHISLERLCRMIDKNRNAVAKTSIGFYNGVDVFYWTGSIYGRISESPKGEKGFGWDSIFIPNKENSPGKITFAEMSVDKKNRLSMRRKALFKLKDFLSNEEDITLQQMMNMTAEMSAKLLFKLEKSDQRAALKPNFNQHIFNHNRELLFKSPIEKNDLAELDLVSNNIFSIAKTPYLYDEQPGSFLENSYFIKINIPFSVEQAEKLDGILHKYEFNQYATYGDSILKYLRNYIIDLLGSEKEDALYIHRSSNAKFFDEILQLRTAHGEALYYNPVEMESPIEYIYNAFLKNENDRETNSIFRNYVLPDLASIWVYSEPSIKTFAEKNGDLFYVPLISLAEMAAYLVLKNTDQGNKQLTSFLQEYLVNYTLRDVKNDWPFRAFQLFPAKKQNAENHLNIIRYLLEKYDLKSYISVLNNPENMSDVLKVLNIYKDILIAESKNPRAFHDQINNILKTNGLTFTETVLTKPGLKIPEAEIPNTPKPDFVFLQGSIDYMGYDNINQLYYSHNLTRSFIDDTLLLTILDADEQPLLNMPYKSIIGEEERKIEIYKASVLFRFVSLLLLENVDFDLKKSLIHAFNSLI